MTFRQWMMAAILLLASVEAVAAAIQVNSPALGSADYYRTRTSPIYFPSYLGPQPGPDPTYQTSGTGLPANGYADDILQNKFVTGYFQPPVQFPDPIAWTIGSPGYQFLGVMIRHGWAEVLADAYWYTGNTQYLTKCIELMRNWWAQEQPPGTDNSYYGIEMGSRILAWIHAFYRFKNSPALSDDDLLFIVNVLHAHGVEAATVTNLTTNQGTSVYSALAQIAIVFPDFAESATWQTQAYNLLTNQLTGSILPDGLQYELSPGYDVNVLGAFSIDQRLAQLNGIAVPTEFDVTLNNMYLGLLKLARPDGLMPLINDSGSDVYHEAWMPWGAVQYNRPDYKWDSFRSLDYVSGALGGVTTDEENAFAAIPTTAPVLGSLQLPNSGFDVMRTGWTCSDLYLLFDHGNDATQFTAHLHRARMNVDIWAFGRSMIVDPGQCDYNDGAAAFFSSPLAHNVIRVSGIGYANAMSKADWMSVPTVDVAGGEVAISGGPLWRRTVVFVKPAYWVIVDTVTGTRLHNQTVDQPWHWVPGTLSQTGNEVLITYPATSSANGNLMLKWPDDLPITFLSEPGYLATAVAGTAPADVYGKAPAPYLVARQTQLGSDNLVTFPTLVMPYTGTTPPSVTLNHVSNGSSSGVRVTSGYVSDDILVNGGSGVSVWDYTYNGKVAVVRHLNDQSRTLWQVILHSGTSFEMGTLRIKAALGYTLGDTTITFFGQLQPVVSPQNPHITIWRQ